MVDIQYLTAEIRRGKERRKKKQDDNIMVCPIPQGDHNKMAHTLKVTYNIPYTRKNTRRADYHIAA